MINEVMSSEVAMKDVAMNALTQEFSKLSRQVRELTKRQMNERSYKLRVQMTEDRIQKLNRMNEIKVLLLDTAETDETDIHID